MSATEAESSTAHHRVRLTKDGYAFLWNYVCTVGGYPQKTEKQAILASLRAIPGNEAFTLDKLSSWFARHRTPDGTKHTPILLDDETILFPKLTSKHLQLLRCLYKKRPDPSEGIITFWADRLIAERTEIVAWIRYQQEKEKANDDVGSVCKSPDTLVEFPRPHLPTPDQSLSPSISPYTRMPSLPPIAVKVEDSRPYPSPVSSLGAPSSKLVSTTPDVHSNEPHSTLGALTRLQQAPGQSPPVAMSVPKTMLSVDGKRDSNATLTATLTESLRPNAAPHELPPRTADEFAKMFGEVENMIDTFMKRYDNGQLVRLGWDSSLSTAAL